MPVGEGHPVRYDYAYERKGVCNLFLFVEPRRGWRKVFVRDRRTKVDWAECVRRVLDQIYPQAIRVRLVLDNVNTHTIGALYEAFAPEEARRLARRLELHPTPRHGSWLNMAEAELSILDRQIVAWIRRKGFVPRSVSGRLGATRRKSPSTGALRLPVRGSS